MALEYRIDPVRRIVLSRAWGVLTDGDLRRHQKRLLADPEFSSDFAQLFDLKDVEQIEVTANVVRELAAVEVFGAGARRAFCAPRDAIYGLARMFEIRRETSPDEIRVFRDEAAAREWLGLGPADPAHPGRPGSKPS